MSAKKVTAEKLLEDIQALIAKDVALLKVGKPPTMKADDLTAYGRMVLAIVDSQNKLAQVTRKKLSSMTEEELLEAIKEVP